MSNSNFIPRREVDFLNWQGVFITGASSRYKILGIPDNLWKELLNLQSDYQNKYHIAANPETHTPGAIERRKEARKVYEARLRIVIKGYITYNPTVADDERKDLGLPVHKTGHTPAPVATEAPDLEVDISTIGRLIIHFFMRGGHHKKGKPAGQHGAEVGWMISNTPPARWEDLTHSAIDTNSPFTLSFENDQRGKTVYFALRWENTRGEKGPWSEIESAIIP
jgi:hypothetical protein